MRERVISERKGMNKYEIIFEIPNLAQKCIKKEECTKVTVNLSVMCRYIPFSRSIILEFRIEFPHWSLSGFLLVHVGD